MITFASRNAGHFFLKIDKNNFSNLCELLSVFAVSVKFYLTRLSAVVCNRFTFIPVFICVVIII